MFNSVILPTTIAFVPTPITQIAMSVTEIEQRCNELRNDLKIWEKKFAAQNNGRKAGRDDIKANEEICTHATRHDTTPCRELLADQLQQTSIKSTISYESN
jgi:hypothetical protein